MSKNILVWGSGRWATHYINEILNSEDIHCENLGIISNSMSLAYSDQQSKVNINHYSPACLPLGTTDAYDYSLVINKNANHQHSCLIASYGKHHILCEKPLSLDNHALNICIQNSRSYNKTFWESMLPTYCSYYDHIIELVKECDKLLITWSDPIIEAESSLRAGKLHDQSILYTMDCLPHICSILTKLAFEHINANSGFTLLDYSSDSGQISCQHGPYQVEANVSRVSQIRERTISGYLNNSLIFAYDITTEPGGLSYLHDDFTAFYSPVLRSFIPPIRLQLLDFLGIIPSQRERLSFHAFHISRIDGIVDSECS